MRETLPRLKWHMLRQRAGDAAHLRANLVAGIAAGAALEVDIGLTADNHFVCLHDLTLDRETTGSGPVYELERAAIEKLRLRDSDGGVLDDRPLFLDEIVVEAGQASTAKSTTIQLDIKPSAEQFGVPHQTRLRNCLGACAPSFLVGSCDHGLVEQIRTTAPDIARGFDPLFLYTLGALKTAGHFNDLADTTIRLAPDVRIYYLQADLVLKGIEQGVNLIGLFKKTGAEIDVWTIDADRPNLRQDLKTIVSLGCDQITTNDPVRLDELLRELV